MEIALVFDDWRDQSRKSIYSTFQGKDLSMGVFRSGSTFRAEIHLNPGDAAELEVAMKSGYRPVFWATN